METFFGLITELFLSFFVLFALVHNSFISKSSYYNYPLLNKQILYQTLFSLCLSLLLCLENYTSLVSFSSLIVSDSCSTVCKIIIFFSSIASLGISQSYLSLNKINSFEYYIITLLAIISMCLLLSSLDLITIYISMEMLSLNLYVLAAFKRYCSFSVEAGLKYFI